jgi:hypothetical protein
MKKVKPNRWFLAGIIFECLAIILMKLPRGYWFFFIVTLLAVIFMAISFQKSDEKK